MGDPEISPKIGDPHYIHIFISSKSKLGAAFPTFFHRCAAGPTHCRMSAMVNDWQNLSALIRRCCHGVGAYVMIRVESDEWNWRIGSGKSPLKFSIKNH